MDGKETGKLRAKLPRAAIVQSQAVITNRFRSEKWEDRLSWKLISLRWKRKSSCPDSEETGDWRKRLHNDRNLFPKFIKKRKKFMNWEGGEGGEGKEGGWKTHE